MKRYVQKLVADNLYIMEENKYGIWVKYEDVEELEQQNEELTKMLIAHITNIDSRNQGVIKTESKNLLEKIKQNQ